MAGGEQTETKENPESIITVADIAIAAVVVGPTNVVPSRGAVSAILDVLSELSVGNKTRATYGSNWLYRVPGPGPLAAPSGPVQGDLPLQLYPLALS